jgi:hypothetical protein
MAEPQSLDVAIRPRNPDYDPDDDRWRAQVGSLIGDLGRQLDIELRSTPVGGTKGGIDELIVALGSAGAFTAAVECLRAWLGRDRNRRIEVHWDDDDDGAAHFVTLTGAAIDRESVQEIARAAARRVGGPAWPADTGLS